MRQWQIRNRPGDLIAEFDLGLLKDVTPFPYRLHLEQHRLTPIQLEILRRDPDVEINFGHTLTGFTQDADGVSVTLATKDGDRTIKGFVADRRRWRPRSAVRKGLDIEFEGFTSAGTVRGRQHAL